MIDFSITRIPNNDLIGLLFPPLLSFSDYEIEIVKPEFVEDKALASSTGSIYSAPDRKCAVIDISKYDYIIVPVDTKENEGFCSGLREHFESGGFQNKSIKMMQTGSTLPLTAWGVLEIIPPFICACINLQKNSKIDFVIGFRRHRSDNVNPRSPQRPELEPIEIRERQESEPEPMPEIAEPEEETPEEVEE